MARIKSSAGPFMASTRNSHGCCVPFGLRGVGEVPIVPPMAAIAIAIYHATGVRMRQLPMSPSKVLEALWARQSNGHQGHGEGLYATASVEQSCGGPSRL
jgi:hypothetical protein